MLQARRWLSGRELVVVADSGLAALEFLAAISRRGVACVTRLRLDAALYGVPPQNGQDSTVGGTDREHGHAAAAVGRLAAVSLSGLNPSGPRLASASQR